MSKVFFRFTALWVFVIILFANILNYNTLNAQTIPDISSISVDELSDNQIVELMNRASAMGYTEDDFINMARGQGMPAAELAKLSKRIKDIQTARVARAQSNIGQRDRKQSDLDVITNRRAEAAQAVNASEIEIFGLGFFTSAEKLSFEPSLNAPLLKGYVLGPGDELYIDIYGASEQYYEAKIGADGRLLLQNIGPIQLTGLTIEQASQRIKTKLASVYAGMAGSNPNTFVNVSLGNVRTIKVNLVGEVRMPGTYTVSALSNAFNALYLAGGPNTNGTLRAIQVYRNNNLVATIDAYEYLLQGKTSQNVQLQDQDVIIVNPFIARISITGAVKRPGIFEVKGEENFNTLLQYAGGFTDDAYRERISVSRNTDTEKIVSDIFKDQFQLFTTKGGDIYYVGKILDRYQNRVQIKGAVFREGSYAVTDDLTVKELIKRADGLRGDAYLKRALITRTQEDLTTQTLAFDLGALMQGQLSDIKLAKEDILTIASIYDIREEFYVKITGEVNNGGVFPYSENMTVEDLVLLAKGLRESATESNIEIARRIKDQNARDISEIINLKINKDLSLNSTDKTVKLEPFDHVIIRPNPNFKTERLIKVEGEVFFPGEYAIRNVNERISDVVKRAGGLNEFAYPKGATLIRYTEFFERDSELVKKRANLSKVLNRLEQDNIDLTESEKLFLDRLDKKLFSTELSDADTDYAAFAKRERLLEISQRNALFTDVNIREMETIGINLEEIMKNPGSRYDLILEEGDVLIIPKQLQTVRLRGKLLYPTIVRYEAGKSMKYFINHAGGFETRAKRRQTYVVYANGEVARTRSFLFIKNYPSVEPGAEVIVPAKPPKLPMQSGDILGISTGLATLLLILSQLDFSSGQ
ncbi:MAG TPA: SLBB domain-containing protein [Cyclobacteriaceae bacterium]|nr:SLBB domain-containing protein [Cyclobacteriaceae bacterium]